MRISQLRFVPMKHKRREQLANTVTSQRVNASTAYKSSVRGKVTNIVKRKKKLRKSLLRSKALSVRVSIRLQYNAVKAVKARVRLFYRVECLLTYRLCRWLNYPKCGRIEGTPFFCFKSPMRNEAMKSYPPSVQ